MGKVIGIGGIFIRSAEPKVLMDWYKNILDIELEKWGGIFPIQNIAKEEYQVFSIFKNDSTYFDTKQAYMLNWMVDDLDSLVESLKAKQVDIIGYEQNEYGKFAWINDCEGNKLELWQPSLSITN